MSAVSVIESELNQLIETRGFARIAFPGGRSALQLMEVLSNVDLAWSSVAVTLVDERSVNHLNEASNSKLVNETLLVNRAGSAVFEPLFNGLTAGSSVHFLNSQVKPLDIAILGVGEDGHFASLFPAEEPVLGLVNSRAGFVATETSGSPCVPRISMTLSQILSAPLVVLLVSSEAKRERVLVGLKKQDPLNPVSYLLQSDHRVVIEWPNGSVVTAKNGVLQ